MRGGDFLRHFSLILVTGNVCGSRNCDLMWIFGFIGFFCVVRGDRGVGVVEVA